MASMKNAASVGCKPQQRLGQARALLCHGMLGLLATTAAVAAEPPQPHRNNFEITPFAGAMGASVATSGCRATAAAVEIKSAAVQICRRE